MKKLKDIEKQFDERFSWLDGSRVEKGEVLKDDVKSFYNKQIKQILAEIVTELHRIRASIPLTGGLIARKKVKELIEKLERIKKA